MNYSYYFFNAIHLVLIFNLFVIIFWYLFRYLYYKKEYIKKKKGGNEVKRIRNKRENGNGKESRTHFGRSGKRRSRTECRGKWK